MLLVHRGQLGARQAGQLRRETQCSGVECGGVDRSDAGPGPSGRVDRHRARSLGVSVLEQVSGEEPNRQIVRSLMRPATAACITRRRRTDRPS